MNIIEEKKKCVEATMRKAQSEIGDLIGMPVSITYRIRINNISDQHIIHTVCKVLNVTYSEIMGPSWVGNINIARQLSAWLLENYCGLSPKEISKVINRERSGIGGMVNHVNNMIQTNDPAWLPALKEIERIILKLDNKS